MKYQEFKKLINKPFFNNHDIKMYKATVVPAQLHLWKKRDYIHNIKRGLYYFVDKKQDITVYDVAAILYEPSYISVETALHFYGVIPDITQTVTAVTTKTTRTFTNDFGTFIYQSIKPALFFGYTVEQTSKGKYLFAEPEKALLDFLYLRLGKIENESDIAELRFNYEVLREIISTKKINEYAKEFAIQKIERVIKFILQQC